jgi:hypothetical protein
MRNFILGLLIASVFWLALFSMISIPEYTIEVECRKINYI